MSVDGDLNVSGSLVGGAHSHGNYVDWYSFDTEMTGKVDWPSFNDHIYGGMHHERYTDAEAVSAIKAADGSGSGFDADLLDGQQASAFAAVNHYHGMLPIAYGDIVWDGSVFTASRNVSSYWDSTNKRYVITIEGCNVDGGYPTIVMASNLYNTGRDYVPTKTTGLGKILVKIYNSAGNPVQDSFTFVTFDKQGTYAGICS